MHRSRRTFLNSMATLPLATGALLTTVRAFAADPYPSRSIKFVVPFAAGSSTDIAARAWAEVVAAQLRPPSVIVENRAGAGGTIGATFVARATPDGYTLLYSTATTWAVSQFVYPDLPYKPTQDLEPIAVTTSVPVFLVVSGNSDIKDFNDLAARVRANPDNYNYGTNGIGANSHITCKLLANRMGSPRLQHVPFKQGSQGVMAEIMAGRLTFAVDPWSVVGGHVQSGRLRALAVVSNARLSVAPEIPTVSELLGQEFNTMTWSGLWGPKGVDQDIVRVLHNAIAAGYEDKQLVKQYENQGTPLMPNMTLDQVRTFMTNEVSRWEKIVQEVDVKI